jgi:hypothetical protein
MKIKRSVGNLDAFRYLTAVNKSRGPAELVYCNVVRATVSSGPLAALLGGGQQKLVRLFSILKEVVLYEGRILSQRFVRLPSTLYTDRMFPVSLMETRGPEKILTHRSVEKEVHGNKRQISRPRNRLLWCPGRFGFTAMRFCGTRF